MSAALDLTARGLAARALRSARVTIDAIDPPLVDGEVDSNHPLISGRAPANSLVSVYVNGAVSGTALATALGTWAYQLPARPNGEYSVVARASPASNALALTINDPLQPISDYTGNPALFDMNSAGGVYWGDGTQYASGSDLLTALGASVSGITAAFGGFEDSDNPYEYFPAPAFDSLPTLSSGSGFSASAVAGELNVTASSATNGYVSYTLAGYKGRAFRMSADGRQGTIASNVPFLATTLVSNALGGNNATSAALGSSMASRSVYGSGATSGSSYWGLRGTNSGNGTCYLDNWTIREVMPLPGWGDFADGVSSSDGLGWSCVFDGVLPTPPASTPKVLVQADSGSENNRVVLRLDSTGALVLLVFYNASVGSNSITLRTGLIGGERVRVAFGIVHATNGTDEGLVVSINGEARASITSVSMNVPGVSHARIGVNSSGTGTFDGTINQVAFLQGRAPGDWVEFASRLDDTALVVGGDSYVDGAAGVSLKASLATALGLACINIGAGGTTLAQQATKYQAKPYLAGLRFVHWDGSDNGYSSVTADIANYQTMVDAQGGTERFVFIAPVPVPNPAQASSATPTAQSLRCAERVTEMIAAFGAAHVFDPLATLQALGNGGADDNNDIAAGLVPRSCLYDATNGQVHLSQTAMDAVATSATLAAKIAAL